jgi:predicted Zn-dependent protease
LIAHHTVNAGAGSGGKFAIFSGLFKQCETIEEFLGVIAHEVAYVKGNHMIKMGQAEEKNMLVAAIAFALGGVAALAAGDMAPLVAGLSGGSGMFMGGVLKHSRDMEIQADSDAVDLLTKAGIPATGLLSFLTKLEKLHRNPDINPYHQSHPLTSDRITALKNRLATMQAVPWPQRDTWQEKFTHIRAKILAFTLRTPEILNMYKGNATTDQLARTIAYGRENKTEKALLELDRVMTVRSKDPFLLELKAQLLMDKHDFSGAIQALKDAIILQPRALYLKMSLAHLLTEENKNVEDALKILKEITQRGENTDFAWYLLGKAYAQKNLPGHALWASGEYALRTGDVKEAEIKFKRAKGYFKTEPDLKLKLGDSKVDVREAKERDG